MVLVTRGCHLLDSLVVVSCEAHVKVVCGSGEGFVRVVVLTPRETRRVILVELGVKSVKWSSRIKVLELCEHSL
jgi:hypothetical protein